MSANLSLTVVDLRGELDIGRKEELHRALTIEVPTRAVLLDLSDVTYADSTALTELLRFKLQADDRNVLVAIVVVAPQLERIIRYAGLHEVFNIFQERAAALEYLASGS